MEILLLVIQVRNFRINRDDCFSKLEKVSQRVNELIVTDSHVTTSTCFKPTVAVATQQNSRTRCMIKCIAFYYGLQWSTEQSTTGTVVTNHIVCKVHFRAPFQVFNTEAFTFIDSCIQRIHEGNLEFLGTVNGFLIIRSNVGHFVLSVKDFHGIRANELNLVTLTTPIETVGLRMHVSAYYGLVIQTLYNLQVSTMNIDCIVHHAFVQPVTRYNLALTS